MIRLDHEAVWMKKRDTPAIMPEVGVSPRIGMLRTIPRLFQAAAKCRVIAPIAAQIQVIVFTQFHRRPGLLRKAWTLDQQQVVNLRTEPLPELSSLFLHAGRVYDTPVNLTLPCGIIWRDRSACVQ